jgi:hypothetical protein
MSGEAWQSRHLLVEGAGCASWCTSPSGKSPLSMRVVLAARGARSGASTSRLGEARQAQSAAARAGRRAGRGRVRALARSTPTLPVRPSSKISRSSLVEAADDPRRCGRPAVFATRRGGRWDDPGCVHRMTAPLQGRPA